ncbi:hypothetical protein DSM112329_03288 [Paraconexibacter sp. AEG42_29]|uniref:Uncharacterized protein n=1 Tax=Paraconexibacter sp. AEG42_29 TaxID=2997339 RepID=A0AAU7AXN9_9ACTN
MPRLPKLTPWIAALQAGFIAREHFQKLTPADRVLLKDLVTKSRGLPRNLTANEKAEVRRIVGELDAKGAVWKLAPVGKRLGKGRRR